jgi:CHAD domain-containing protein
MGYVFGAGEGPDAVRRIAGEELDGAITHLRAVGGGPAGIHEARKALKRVRSALRLVRSGMDAACYRREMDAVRDAGRSLADARDAEVLVQTLDGLVEGAAGAVADQAFAGLRALLVSERGSSEERALDAAAGVVGILREVRARVDGWEVDDDPAVVADGLRRAHRRGRDRMRGAEEHASDQALHEWRKRVKDLWHHLTLVTPAWPAVLEVTATAAHELSNALGDDHDLALLWQVAEERPGTFDAPADSQLLGDLIARRRAALQASAWPLGHRLYAERPKAYGRRISSYLEVWHREAR